MKHTSLKLVFEGRVTGVGWRGEALNHG